MFAEFLKSALAVREYKVVEIILAQFKSIFAHPLNFKAVIASFLAIAELFGALIFDTPQTPRGQQIDMSQWQLVWSDEFDGDALNTDTWSIHCDCTMRRGGYWDYDMADVSDGNLTIKTQYLEDGKYGSGWYTLGIDTSKSYNKKYGYFECRCKCPPAQGLWSAFWMFTGSVSNIDGTGRDGAEIDIFESPYFAENKLKRYAVSQTVHFDGYGEEHQQVCLGKFKVPAVYDDFNTYAVEWNENEYIFYINGIETNRLDGDCVSQTEEFIILSTEVGGNNGISAVNTDGTPFKDKDNINLNKADADMDFVIDYVRVYDKIS